MSAGQPEETAEQGRDSGVAYFEWSADRMEPAPTDLTWLRMEPRNARPTGWLRTGGRPPGPHACEPPTWAPSGLVEALGGRGDVWRCLCGRLWIVRQGHTAFWERPPIVMRLAYWLGLWPRQDDRPPTRGLDFLNVPPPTGSRVDPSTPPPDFED